MKRTLIIFLTCVFYSLHAQIYLNQPGTAKRNSLDYIGPNPIFRTGDELVIIEIDGNKVIAQKKGDTKQFTFSADNLNRFKFPYTTVAEFWKVQCMLTGAYANIADEGMQYDLRKELEEDAIDFHNYVRSNGLLFDDEYLETHMYSLVLEVLPLKRDDGRPGIISISILSDPAPNAFIFPNGSMYVTTGLLSTINSDEELQAILAHEAAHFMLDHQIVNINLAKKRQKRAEFWAAFATGMAAMADVYMATNNEYYTPGILTASTAILSFSLASAITEQMGLNYSRKQEMEADRAARDILAFLEKKPEALSTALSKIKTYAIANGDYNIISDKGTHPNVDIRIDSIGAPIAIVDPKYDVRLSMVNSFNAILEYNARRFESCAALVQRIIDAGIPTEDDYLLLAMTNLYRFDTPEKNEEAFTLIQKAKALKIIPTITLHKQEALALIRLGRLSEAKASLQSYLTSIEKENERMKDVLNPQEWSRTNRYLLDEYSWTKQMLNKVEKL